MSGREQPSELARQLHASVSGRPRASSQLRSPPLHPSPIHTIPTTPAQTHPSTLAPAFDLAYLPNTSRLSHRCPPLRHFTPYRKHEPLPRRLGQGRLPTYIRPLQQSIANLLSSPEMMSTAHTTPPTSPNPTAAPKPTPSRTPSRPS